MILQELVDKGFLLPERAAGLTPDQVNYIERMDVQLWLISQKLTAEQLLTQTQEQQIYLYYHPLSTLSLYQLPPDELQKLTLNQCLNLCSSPINYLLNSKLISFEKARDLTPNQRYNIEQVNWIGHPRFYLSVDHVMNLTPEEEFNLRNPRIHHLMQTIPALEMLEALFFTEDDITLFEKRAIQRYLGTDPNTQLSVSAALQLNERQISILNLDYMPAFIGTDPNKQMSMEQALKLTWEQQDNLQSPALRQKIESGELTLSQALNLTITERDRIEFAALNAIEREKVYANTDDTRSLYCLKVGSKWRDFINGLSQSLENRELAQYPWAQLNDKDGSFSIFLCHCQDKGCEACERSTKFKESLEQSYIVDQLAYFREKNGFSLTGESKELLQVKDHGELMEYQFNLPPAKLDSILKVNGLYAGYRAQSLINLVKTIDVSPGIINLMPVLPLGENENNKSTYLVRVAGCQTTEVPSLQLLYLLPDFDGQVRDYHHIPRKVENDLSLNSGDIMRITNELFKEGGLRTESFFHENEGNIILSQPKATSPVQVTTMDAKARAFYATYGNSSDEELQVCQSVQISTLEYLTCVKELISEKVNDLEKQITTGEIKDPTPEDLEDSPWKKTIAQKREKLQYSITTINTMIATEQLRLTTVNQASPMESAPVMTKKLSSTALIYQLPSVHHKTNQTVSPTINIDSKASSVLTDNTTKPIVTKKSEPIDQPAENIIQHRPGRS